LSIHRIFPLQHAAALCAEVLALDCVVEQFVSFPELQRVDVYFPKILLFLAYFGEGFKVKSSQNVDIIIGELKDWKTNAFKHGEVSRSKESWHSISNTDTFINLTQLRKFGVG
jgi:hypothetical protein